MLTIIPQSQVLEAVEYFKNIGINPYFKIRQAYESKDILMKSFEHYCGIKEDFADVIALAIADYLCRHDFLIPYIKDINERRNLINSLPKNVCEVLIKSAAKHSVKSISITALNLFKEQAQTCKEKIVPVITVFNTFDLNAWANGRETDQKKIIEHTEKFRRSLTKFSEHFTKMAALY